MQKTSENRLRTEAALSPGVLDVYLSGTADVNVLPELDAFLSDVHATASRARVTSVTVDISALQFINSSCLKSFITWMTTAQAMNEGRYMITFLFQRQSPRQGRTFGALAALAGDGVQVKAKTENSAA
jgi:hypothetical protein